MVENLAVMKHLTSRSGVPNQLGKLEEENLEIKNLRNHDTRAAEGRCRQDTSHSSEVT